MSLLVCGSATPRVRLHGSSAGHERACRGRLVSCVHAAAPSAPWPHFKRAGVLRQFFLTFSFSNCMPGVNVTV